MAFFRSPDNISIELLQKGESLPPAEPWASMPTTGGPVARTVDGKIHIESSGDADQIHVYDPNVGNWAALSLVREIPALIELLEDRDDVLAAEAERVVHHVLELGLARLGHVVQSAGRILVLVVDRRRDHPVLQR